MEASHHTPPSARDRVREIRAVLAEDLDDETTLSRISQILSVVLDAAAPDQPPAWEGYEEPPRDPRDPRDS